MTREEAKEVMQPGQVLVFLFPSKEEVECVDPLDAVNERAEVVGEEIEKSVLSPDG